MICSLQELGIDSKLVQKEYSEGIYVFKDEVEVGSCALSALNLDDEILELDLTPNRADCLNMLGVAYEIAALYEKEVTLPSIEVNSNEENAADYIDVKVEAKEDNPYYGALIIKDVKVGTSPLWLQNRLMAAGIRPISNVVDITNYVLLEYGQPLHAFDYDLFGSKEVVVRRAKDGETIVTLDDQERTLSSDHLVITNGKEPVAIAGVMGGATLEVHAGTTTVLLEAAYFEGATIRKASRDLGLRSDASTRYEKGIAQDRVLAAGRRAAALMAELAGGTIVSGVVEQDLFSYELKTIELDVNRVNNRLGTQVSTEEVMALMNRLGFTYDNNGDVLQVTIPSRRPDIQIEEDLMEEVARLYGYDLIPTTLPAGATTQGALTEYQQKRRQARRTLEGSGLSQVITYSLTSPEKAKGFAFEMNQTPVTLAMPMSEDRSTMRTSLIPHLFDVLSYNINRKNPDVFVYEIGSIFLSNEETLTNQPLEKEMVAGALTGMWMDHGWQGEKKAVDFFLAKGIMEKLFETFGVEEEVVFEQATLPDLHPGRTALVKLDGKEIGFIGQVHPSLQKQLNLKETYVFELDLETILKHQAKPVVYQALPRYPAMTRDIALVVDSHRSAGEVETVIHWAGGELLKKVRLFDLYEGEHMEEGKKSLAFSLTYLDPERTLTDEEVTKAHGEVLKMLEEHVGATLRG
ncbi:phenylalanyl-tRNA synthetase beta chain [Halalkalibacter akibai JCM 9157]|uniref:Phenylalanine--tRNA ligase beta subunit n=1 Tax=Halalkalibacter akibai (strain ATCC 43226 / DSM 21942 / CIP 109018 / JCM 9157 / 1139) TaxID=1236973 RepID=W4QU65_HALA3|nr:phenylalanyl-tRNA synthetase beta chain [Halalkalibacter akibai JCM 9157]